MHSSRDLTSSPDFTTSRSPRMTSMPASRPADHEGDECIHITRAQRAAAHDNGHVGELVVGWTQAYSIRSSTSGASSGEHSRSISHRARSRPLVTPALVTRLPSSTTRSLTSCAPVATNSDHAAWVSGRPPCADDAGVGQQHRAGADAGDRSSGGGDGFEEGQPVPALILAPRCPCRLGRPSASGDEDDVGRAWLVGAGRRRTGARTSRSPPACGWRVTSRDVMPRRADGRGGAPREGRAR